MVRDSLMSRVVLRDQEPIVPFLSRMRQLYDTKEVSTILVAGSSGAYFAASDCVIQMKEYKPYDITQKVRTTLSELSDSEISSGISSGSLHQAHIAPWDELTEWIDNRIPKANRQVTESKKVKVKSAGTDAVILNHESVELRFVEQVVDIEQTNLLGAMLHFLEEREFNSRTSLTDCINTLYRNYESTGFQSLSLGSSVPGNLASVRIQELWAMVNRYRGMHL